MISDPSLSSPVIVSIDKEEAVQRKTALTLRVHVTLSDGSKLYITENYVLANGWIDYSYHWQTATHQLIHRWDNAHPVNLPTSPFHQHIGSEENIQPSEPMTLEKVLAFIANRIDGSQLTSN